MSTQQKIRLWYHIPSTCMWLLQVRNEGYKQRLYNGKCSMLIISIYSFVQGFLSEIVDSELLFLKNSGKFSEEMYNHFYNQNCTRGLEDVLKRFKLLVGVDAQSVKGYDSIINLINLRNGIAHGKGYIVEIEGRPNLLDEKKLNLKNYNSVLKYLYDKKVLIESKNEVSPIVFFNFEVALHFLTYAQSFLFVLIQQSNFNEKSEFQRLLTEACDYQDETDGSYIQVSL